MTSTYHLADHAHACRSGDWIIILDLLQDRYLAASPGAIELVGAGRGLCAKTGDARTWCEKAKSAGLFTTESAPAPLAPTGPAPTGPAPCGPWPRQAAFVASLLWAGRALSRPKGLRPALSVLRRRRAGLQHNQAQTITESAWFASWRPLWPRAYVCLFDTLALSWFLSARGQTCDIVFGVRTGPFSAHCWAMAGEATLNDVEEYCQSFDVIMRA